MMPYCALSQDTAVVRRGLLQIQPTVAPGYLFSAQTLTMYFRANTEYFVHQNVSLRTDAYIYFGSQEKTDLLKNNHSAFLGASYHLIRKNTAFCFGFQPGIAFSETNSQLTGKSKDLRVSTLISFTTGVNQYLNKFLHFFFNLQYVTGTHVPLYSEPVSLNEFRFTMGLGFNLNLIRPKKE
jgi:hypothetical protein